jgi:uncharacterized membrane protein required for colicin V production
MNFGKFQLNWFDLLVLGLTIFGLYRGRKRGMSEELLDLFQWLAIVVLAALFYAPLGRTISKTTDMPPFFGNIAAYAFIAILIKLCFTTAKRAVGEKLVQSDAFGHFEYYLGMLAAPVRYACILIFVLSFVHAKHVSDAERAATARMQEENFGSISFPTFGSLQHTIFHESFSGKFIARHLRDQLVQPADAAGRPHETIAQRRERAVEEVLK